MGENRELQERILTFHIKSSILNLLGQPRADPIFAFIGELYLLFADDIIKPEI